MNTIIRNVVPLRRSITSMVGRSINFYSHMRVRDIEPSNTLEKSELDNKVNNNLTIKQTHIVDVEINDPNFTMSYHTNFGRAYKISIAQEISMNLETGYREEISVCTKTVPKKD